jgi:bifunctional DNA-binding transcriptional regulator/antitoxin component of YhaV-PrlF toxin-antitoxin module
VNGLASVRRFAHRLVPPAESRFSRKNQVTLPVDALRAAGLGPGDDVRVEARGPGRLELVRVDDLVKEFAGVFNDTAYPNGYLDELRREWP